jgi:hypothetical protein|tara:strand:+ start:191 stop:364 length:174 start_codon:yes stop_codon:yes gene_type:complete
MELQSSEKQFVYEMLSRQVTECNDIEEVKDILLQYAMLYFKQQEVLSCLGPPPTIKI